MKVFVHECEFCGKDYHAQRMTSRFCSEDCRKRNHQSKPRAPESPIVAVDNPESILATTRAQLEAAGRVDTPSGQVALLLAARLDANVRESGMGIAAIVREHSRTLAEALKNAKQAADPVDELRERRDSRRVG
jgi:glycerate-2-kinase